MNRTIIVTGSNGQLGSELRDLAVAYPGYNFAFFDRQEMPINSEAVVRNQFEKLKPSFLLNCAAYTAVDQAESDREAANDINGMAVGMLAALCREFGTRFLHVSTDYVFNGLTNKPLTETDAVDPVNAYGASKLLGEKLALEQNPDSIIIRTSWVYSSYGKNFVKTMMRLMRERESINVVSDQFGSPTYAADLAALIMVIVEAPEWQPGIYHFSNEGIISWFDFALAIRELTGASCQVNPIATEQYPTPARRPAYSVMDKTKISQAYGITPTNWKQSLGVCISRLDAQIIS
ncbi:MAG TPA: dTDP-4-dehydrorhamnose reductase [Flavisolibacter sp.]|nr:dTDP-4-dehydrorhamnose reductase [Flavisolibacter sp.]